MRMFWCVLNLHSHVFCFCTFPFCTFCTLCTRTLYINLCGRNGLMSNGNLHDLGYGFHISRRVAHAHHHCKCYRILLFSFRFLCSVLPLYTVHFISLFISLFFMRFTLMSPTHTLMLHTYCLPTKRPPAISFRHQNQYGTFLNGYEKNSLDVQKLLKKSIWRQFG